MKKTSLLLFVLFFTVVVNSFAQTSVTTTPAAADSSAITKAADFYAGKWELVFIGTPQGDAKLIANITRKDTKLTGDLTDASGEQKEPIPITNIEETDEKLIIYFSAQGYDLNVDLEKVDDDNLQGKLMNMFEAKAVRVKQ